MGIESFAGKTPEFLPEHVFAGDLDGWGVIESPLGHLQARFSVKASGTWDERAQTISFSETWTMDNGIVETLDWTIKKLGPHQYSGAERHLEGAATGEQAGCAFHWTYARATPRENGERVVLNFDDWFYAITEQALIVRGSAGRLGLPFAVAHVTYVKRNVMSSPA